MMVRTWVVILLTVGVQPLIAHTQGAPDSCEASAARNLLSVIAPMRGSQPAWLVDGDGPWSGPDAPVKTLWVIALPNQRLEITGRRRGGTETARFRRGADGISDSLVIEDPRRESANPGGATADVLRDYAFIPSHVFYPEAGCWEFTVRASGARHRIVQTKK